MEPGCLRQLLEVLPLAPTFLPTGGLTAIRHKGKCVMGLLSASGSKLHSISLPSSCQQKCISSHLGLSTLARHQQLWGSSGERLSQPLSREANPASSTPRAVEQQRKSGLFAMSS